MPIPFIVGAIAAVAGATGVGLAAKGVSDTLDAKNRLTEADERDKRNRKRAEEWTATASRAMDTLGEHEMKVLSDFKYFSELFERIKNRPEFGSIMFSNNMPKLNTEEIKKASIGAAVLVSSASGAGLGALGGFAASGATTAAVMALGTASTGTAISSLSGAAATNATLAAIGGGSLAAGGGGVALGTALLGAATLGVGLLVGGAIFSFTGSSLSDKADEAYSQMKKNEQKCEEICSHCRMLKNYADRYDEGVMRMKRLYDTQMDKFRRIVYQNSVNGIVDWYKLTSTEQTEIDNMVHIVGLLYEMCKVKLVTKITNEKSVVNSQDIEAQLTKSREFINSLN